MAHIPLGYKIVDGCAVTDEPTVKQIKATYRYYFEGKSLVDAALEGLIENARRGILRYLHHLGSSLQNLPLLLPLSRQNTFTV